MDEEFGHQFPQKEENHENHTDLPTGDLNDSSEDNVLSLNSLSSLSPFQISLIAVIVVLLAGFGVFYSHRISAQNTTSSPSTLTPVPTEAPTNTPIPIPSQTTNLPIKNTTTSAKPTTGVTPTVDCVGPDGKHMTLTKAQCDTFNAAWATPTPSPTLTPTTAPTATPTDTPTLTPTPTI